MVRVKSKCLLKPKLKSKPKNCSPLYLSCQFGHRKDLSFALKLSSVEKKNPDYNGDIKILIMESLDGRLFQKAAQMSMSNNCCEPNTY